MKSLILITLLLSSASAFADATFTCTSAKDPSFVVNIGTNANGLVGAPTIEGYEVNLISGTGTKYTVSIAAEKSKIFAPKSLILNKKLLKGQAGTLSLGGTVYTCAIHTMQHH